MHRTGARSVFIVILLERLEPQWGSRVLELHSFHLLNIVILTQPVKAERKRWSINVSKILVKVLSFEQKRGDNVPC